MFKTEPSELDNSYKYMKRMINNVLRTGASLCYKLNLKTHVVMVLLTLFTLIHVTFWYEL